MGALLADPKIWLAVIGLVTVFVGIYQNFLSERARRKREQKKISQDHSHREESDILQASDELIEINDSIRKQGEISDDWFKKTTRKSQPITSEHDQDGS